VESSEITQLLNEWKSGNRESLDRVMVSLYHELKRLAAKVGAEDPGDTMQATAIVNELYLRLLGQQKPNFDSREHFFSAAARAMRQIRIDHARYGSALKRGGDASIIPLELTEIPALTPSSDIESLDAAVTQLQRFDARKASMVELRYFVGLTVQEVASAFSLSTETVRRELRLAEAWLVARLNPHAS